MIQQADHPTIRRRMPALVTSVAWGTLILVSSLPVVMMQERLGWKITGDIYAAYALSILAIAFLATALFPTLGKLRPFLSLLMILTAARWLVFERLDKLPFIRAALRDPSFNVNMMMEQVLNLTITLTIILTLLLMRKKRRDFYLRLGDYTAPAAPIGWLGVKPGENWKRLGLTLTVYISLGTLAFLLIAGRPGFDLFIKVLPFLPVIFLAAALNAFNEELSYKASLLSVLEGPTGKQQALYMVAFYFGMAHFYGVPYGMIGVLMAVFLGWILAKSMQETGGFFWAWFIHFWQDVWIFMFLAIGSIVPGGG